MRTSNYWDNEIKFSITSLVKCSAIFHHHLQIFILLKMKTVQKISNITNILELHKSRH